MRRALAAEQIDAAYEELGEPGCTYTPPAGAPIVGISVMLKRPDATVGFEGAAIIQEQVIAVRASDMTPVKGGVFYVPILDASGVAIGAETFRIAGDPRQLDSLRLEWTSIVRKDVPNTTPGGAAAALLYEDGGGIELEDGSGVLLLE